MKKQKTIHNVSEPVVSEPVVNEPVVNEYNERVFLCECGNEALLITKNDFDKELYLTIYTLGQFHKKPNIWQRLKYCWYHLTTGKMCEDFMILNYEKAKQIIDWLSLNIK